MTQQVQSLAELRAAWKQNNTQTESRPNNYYPFYRLAFDEKATIRFLPDGNTSNPLGFLVEKLTHELVIGGEKKIIPCPKMFGKDKECPICKHSAALYKAEDKVNGKKFYRSKQHIAQALVIEDPLPYKAEETPAIGTIKLINVGFSIYNIIDEAINDEEDGVEDIPWLFNNGTDFIIKKTKKGEHANYESSKFAKRPRPLSEDELATVEGNLLDLSTLLPKEPELAYLEKMLASAIAGELIETDDAPVTKTSTVTQTAAEPKSTTSVSSPAMDEDEDDADEILRQLRDRHNTK